MCAYTAYFPLCIRFDARRSLETVRFVVNADARPSSAMHVPTAFTQRLKRSAVPRLRRIPHTWGINDPPRPPVPTCSLQLRSVTVANYSDRAPEPPGENRPSARQVRITSCRRPSRAAGREGAGGSERARVGAGRRSVDLVCRPRLVDIGEDVTLGVRTPSWCVGRTK